MTFVPFEEWMPDRASLATGSTQAIDVIPTAEGFETAPGFVDSTSFLPVPQEPMRVEGFVTSLGDMITLAFCKTKIYKYTGTGWQDVTNATADYTTGTHDFWSFDQWGDIIYATNYKDKIQKFDLLGSPRFVDSPILLVGGLRARHLTVIGDFLVLFDTNDNSGANPTPFRMHWSGRLRPEDFTPSLATQAGYRDIVDIGQIVVPIGGQFGFILGEKGSSRSDYIGPPTVWQISHLDEDIGCLYRASAIKLAGTIIWFSPKGWRASAGAVSSAIGSGKVDGYFRSRIDGRSIDRMSHVALRSRPIVLWSYVSVDSPDGYPDEVLYFHTEASKFSQGRLRAVVLGSAGRAPLLTDDAAWGELLVDDSDELIDTEGDERPNLIAVVPVTNTLRTITPSTDKSLMTTKEIALAPAGMRFRVLRVRLVAEGDSDQYRIRIRSRDKQPPLGTQADPWLIPERTGSCAADRRGRYHRFDTELNGRFTSILGLEVYGVVVGSK